MHNPKVLVIGLGQIGYSNAEYMTQKGLTVDGYDISDTAITRAIADGVIRWKAQDFSGYDVYVICISTHKPDDMFVPYLDGLFSIAKRLAYEGKDGALVGIDSTVTRGTSEKILSILEHRLHVAHVPHRFYVHEKADHGVRQTRVLGACEDCCTEKAKEFYGQTLGIPIHPVRSVEVAELCKIVENSYRFMEIAFAEELKMFCDRSELSFDELKGAINSKWNIKILEAKEGIGGHCLPKDSQMFLNLEKNVLDTTIIEAAKRIDNQYRLHIGTPSARPHNTIRTGAAK
jgi:UDP-N-acetyl-D-mannosaminuronic acid dehydrogenase